MREECCKDGQIERMDEMAGTDSRTLKTDDEVEGFLGTEVELDAKFWRLHKKRLIKMSMNSSQYAGLSMDLEVPLKIFRDEREGVNTAEVFLLPDELAVFTKALIQHPLLLPTSYSQHLSMERGMYSLRLKSQEPFGDFAERLSKALSKLG